MTAGHERGLKPLGKKMALPKTRPVAGKTVIPVLFGGQSSTHTGNPSYLVLKYHALYREKIDMYINVNLFRHDRCFNWRCCRMYLKGTGSCLRLPVPLRSGCILPAPNGSMPVTPLFQLLFHHRRNTGIPCGHLP